MGSGAARSAYQHSSGPDSSLARTWVEGRGTGRGGGPLPLSLLRPLYPPGGGAAPHGSHSRAKLSLDRPQMRKRVTRRRCSRSLRVSGGVLFLTRSSLEHCRFRESLPYPCLLARDEADGCFARGAAISL